MNQLTGGWKRLKLLPPGELGEIIIKGPLIVPGYWRKPEETKHAIRDEWLYTGDIGKMDKDGWFYVIDRKKTSPTSLASKCGPAK